jgi:hypothetical protein
MFGRNVLKSSRKSAGSVFGQFSMVCRVVVAFQHAYLPQVPRSSHLIVFVSANRRHPSRHLRAARHVVAGKFHVHHRRQQAGRRIRLVAGGRGRRSSERCLGHRRRRRVRYRDLDGFQYKLK